MQRHTPAITLSIRVSPEIREQLEYLSVATNRTKSFLAAEAIENFLTTQTWQVKALEKSITKANRKNSKFIEHEKVTSWLKSWGTKKEKNLPE